MFCTMQFLVPHLLAHSQFFSNSHQMLIYYPSLVVLSVLAHAFTASVGLAIDIVILVLFLFHFCGRKWARARRGLDLVVQWGN